ncbi:MAG TPA: hypothetical protein VNA57_13295 [Acidimicrobiales bacterium]|nr:hypothetical protein [Acidimicrobiales bacterium]
MTTARVAGQDFDLIADEIEKAVAGVEPEPIHEHFAVVAGRRYPPKQVLAIATGLDRADFTTHQARSVLRRTGFGVYRLSRRAPAASEDPRVGPKGGAEASALRPFSGRWIAQDGFNVLFDADSPELVVKWLGRHGRKARVWRVPASTVEAGSSLSVP